MIKFPSFRNIAGIIGLICLCCYAASPARAEGHIEGQLSFSTDGGKTYSTASPVIAAPQEIRVRADFAVRGETRPIAGEIVTTNLRSEEADFASANVGKQNWTGKPAWLQRLNTYWFRAQRPQSVIYKLDVRARPAGVMGKVNKWDAEKKAFIDASLPAAPALGPGTHAFIVRLNYRIAGSQALVLLDLPFQITISEAPAKVLSPTKTASPGMQPDPPVLPVLQGEHVWDAGHWQGLDGAAAPASVPPFVRPRSGQEIALRLDNITAGNYYLRAQVESGNNSGEEELYTARPFLYVNGHAIDFARAMPTTPFAKTNVTTIESRHPIHLQNGDEVRWNSAQRGGKLVGGVAIARQPLAFAPLEIRPFYDPALNDVFRLDGHFKVTTVPAETVAGEFTLDVRNVSGSSARFQTHIEVRDFWQRVAARKDEVLALDDRGRQTLTLPFTPGDSDRYRAIVHVSGPGDEEQNQEFDILVNNPQGGRPRLWLNDNWEWTSIADDGTLKTRTLGAPPEDAARKWQSVDLPASWQDSKPKDHLAWYRRSFTVPPWLAGRRLFLHFTRIAYESRVFLNGRQINTYFGQNGPFEQEITGSVRPGENELLIGVRDGIAALEPDELTSPHLEFSQASRYRAPIPRNLCGVGEIWLYGAGPEPLRNIFVQTSFRHKTVRLEIKAPDLPTGTRAVLTNRVLYEGREVLRMPDAAVSGSQTGPVIVSQAWPEPILWNPDAPRLLQLVTELKSADGKLLDRLDTRFGFREFWPEGDSLMWNGMPVKFAANPFLATWGWGLTNRDKRGSIRKMLLQSKRMGVTMQRHIYDPEYRAEMNDEEGIVMVEGFFGIHNPTRQIIASDEFWANAAKFDSELIRGLRNSPSIVTWYVSNEFMGASEPDNRRRLEELGRALAPLDPTRIFEFGCDLDLGGYAKIISTHYPVDFRALREERGVLPEAAYWHFIGQPLQPGEKVPAGLIRSVANVKGESPITWGQKPLVINETLFNFFFNPPDGFSRLVGDATYAGSVATERAYQLTNDWFIRGHRDAGASVITPWEVISRNPLKRGIPAVDINPLQRYAHFYGGQMVDFDINLHHDRFRSSSLEFVWTLLQNGKTLQREAKTETFESGALHREHLRLTMPKVMARTHCELVLQLKENGKELRRVTLPLDVYPHISVSWPAGVRVAVYDPKSTFTAVLKTFSGPSPLSLTRIEEAALRNVQVLIIGNNTAGGDDAVAQAALKKFLDGGGRVLVLSQEKTPTLLPSPPSPTKLLANRLWTFRPDHPALKGLTAEDCSNWYPTQRTGADFYLKPESGNWRTLLESGGPNGMIYSGLLETRIGDGLLVCSQLDLTGHFDQNPIAALLWRNLLAYLAQKPAATARAGVWGEADGPLRRALEPLHAAATPVASADDLRNFDVVLLDGAAALSDADVAAINRFVQDGGQLMIHGVTPANRATVSKLCGSAVRVLTPTPRAWSGRAIHTGESTFSAGLTNYDLFWKRRPDTQDYAAIFVNESSTLEPLGDWIVEPAQGRTLLYPGFLAEVPLGQGRVLLDNLNWLQPGPLVRTNARRIASTLLTNLGVRLEAVNRVAIPTNLKYSPVDLSGVLNRSFVDEVADDGQGGWTDQGPDADLRGFPTEPAIQSFGGVPFRIEKERSALVLASRFRPKGPPESVELPVNGRVDALFFLQTSAWTNNQRQANYIVHYADGSQYEIQLTGGVNLRDWTASNTTDAFPAETDTITHVAWSGKTKAFSSVSLYMMAWPNPHPERAIRSVTFQSLNQGVPILVGVTLGVRQAASTHATPQRNADAALAQKLIAEGRTARQAGQAATAIERFKAAIAADSREATPYLELASVYESQKNWPEAIATYQLFLHVKPDDLETLFRLGRAYEENGDWDKAEQTYRHSLEVNRNQPEILHALAELAQRRPKH